MLVFFLKHLHHLVKSTTSTMNNLSFQGSQRDISPKNKNSENSKLCNKIFWIWTSCMDQKANTLVSLNRKRFFDWHVKWATMHYFVFMRCLEMDLSEMYYTTRISRHEKKNVNIAMSVFTNGCNMHQTSVNRLLSMGLAVWGWDYLSSVSWHWGSCWIKAWNYISSSP